MRARIETAATRGAIVGLSIYLAGVAIGRVPIARWDSRYSLIFAGGFVLAWALVTAWQVRSRVDRWSWWALYLGFLLSLILASILSASLVRLLLFIKFGR